MRISPFDPARRRQTSFARVEVLPTVLEDDSEVEVRADDLKMDFFRSSGPGGPNVQKVASAVRLTHVPTGIVVHVPDREVATPESRLRDEDLESQDPGAA